MRVGSAALVALTASLLLAGCGSDPSPADPSDPAESGSGSTPSPTATTPTPRTFQLPEVCADVVSADTAATFAADGLELLGGPDGKYGTEYFADPTLEEQAGGITCVWGDESDNASTVVISVAPVSPSTRSEIVADLVAQGLNEAQVDGALTYAQVGDDVSSPGILNVVRDDSWISVIEALGGETRFQRATELVDDVTAQVYVAE